MSDNAVSVLERLSQRADQAEVFGIDSESTAVSFEASKLKSFDVSQTGGLAARAMHEGRLGFAAAGGAGSEDQLIDNVIESARHGDAIDLRFPGTSPAGGVEVYDPRLATLPADRLIEIGQEVIEIIRSADDQALVSMDLERQVRRTVVLNSSGARADEEKSTLSVSMRVEKVQSDDVLMVFRYFSTARWNEDYREVAESLAESLRRARRQATLRSGRMPVLFSPSGAVVLGLPLMMGLDGKDVYRGISPLAGRVGERLFDDKLTLSDDPTLPGRPGSGDYDDEAVPRRRSSLIERGELRGFLYDLKTAAQAGVEPTGSGERGLFSPPSPSFSNLVLDPGTTPLKGIIAGLDEALLVESPLGLGQGNVISGAFSNSLSLGFKIERGEVVGRVKDVAIAGNVYEDLQHIAALSQETEWVYGGMSLPYVLLPSLNVVTKA